MLFIEITALMNVSNLDINFTIFAWNVTYGSLCVVWVGLTDPSVICLRLETDYRWFGLTDFFLDFWCTVEPKELLVNIFVLRTEVCCSIVFYWLYNISSEITCFDYNSCNFYLRLFRFLYALKAVFFCHWYIWMNPSIKLQW